MSNQIIEIKIEGLDTARREIANFPRKIQATLRDHSVLSQIGTQMALSAKKTIDAGGRPVAYKPLAESTKAEKLRKYKKESHILVAGGQLRQSLDYEVSGGQLYLTSQSYLKYHQFEDGRKKANFPARPIWGVQDEDKPEILDIVITALKK